MLRILLICMFVGQIDWQYQCMNVLDMSHIVVSWGTTVVQTLQKTVLVRYAMWWCDSVHVTCAYVCADLRKALSRDPEKLCMIPLKDPVYPRDLDATL